MLAYSGESKAHEAAKYGDVLTLLVHFRRLAIQQRQYGQTFTARQVLHAAVLFLDLMDES